MAPKPGVSLFGYALCMVTTGVFDVKSNIPPEWRPNLRQPFTAYAISSFFYTAVGTPFCGTRERLRPPVLPASARLSSGRPPASAGFGPMGSLGRDAPQPASAALPPRPRPEPRPARAATHLSLLAPRPTLSPPPRRRSPHALPDISVPAGGTAWLARRVRDGRGDLTLTLALTLALALALALTLNLILTLTRYATAEAVLICLQVAVDPNLDPEPDLGPDSHPTPDPKAAHRSIWSANLTLTLTPTLSLTL